jgi:tetratricopeptide (TPR) repeat protein
MVSIRKEQGLLIVALAFGYWMYSGLAPVKKAGKPRSQKREYVSPAGATPITVATTGPKNLKELFVEPSESRPLPPRDDLPFLDVPALPVVLVPLEVGQQPKAYWELRHPALKLQGGGGGAADASPAQDGAAQDGAAKDGAAKDGAAKDGAEADGANGGAAADGGVAPRGVAPRGVATQSDPAKRYDRLELMDGRKFWGLFLGEDKTKFRLASGKGTFTALTFKFQWINKDTGKTMSVRDIKGDDVAKLGLAKTLRNEVGMRMYKLQPSTTNVEKQRAFIQYLLGKARLEPWVYEKALARAHAYMKFSSPDEEGLLIKAQVLRAMGDLPGEYKLFRDLDDHKKLKGSSFQLRGLGMVEARLNLTKLAERHLRQAVAISKPIDPRNYAALATFLLDRGRADEAVEAGRMTLRFKTRRNPSPAEIVGFHRVGVRACLAVGDLTGATAAAASSVDANLQTLADYQEACVTYAKKEFATAEPLFQKVFNTGTMPDALLGLAACQLAKGDLEAGKANLEKLVDEQPRLRHLGLAGLGLAMSAGQGNDALEKIDAAIVTFPNHPYLLYLRGRQRRLNGDLDGAIEPLKKALRLHDDFLEALAELTVTHYELARRNRDAKSLISAIRYVDRLTHLDQLQGGQDLLFLEMQGKIHYGARDLRGARAAFEKGKDQSNFCVIGLAMVEYAQKRQDLAEFRLRRLIRDLQQKDDPFRLHAEKLLELMVRHGNKEQVIDKFDRKELGKAYTGVTGSGRKQLADGELRMPGKFNRSGLVVAKRAMAGPGRFVEISIEMKVGGNSAANFAGIAIEIPARGAATTRFRVRLGMDDRGKVLLERKDGRKAIEPLRTDIDVTRDEWHTLVLSVADPDDVDTKKTSRFLKVFFDGQPLHDPAKPIKLLTLRRTDNKTTPFSTEMRAEGNDKFPVDIAFRNYRRIQEKMK